MCLYIRQSNLMIYKYTMIKCVCFWFCKRQSQNEGQGHSLSNIQEHQLPSSANTVYRFSSSPLPSYSFPLCPIICIVQGKANSSRYTLCFFGPQVCLATIPGFLRVVQFYPEQHYIGNKQPRKLTAAVPFDSDSQTERGIELSLRKGHFALVPHD